MRKMIGFGLVVVSDVALIVALTADYIGLGGAPQAIGWKQTVLAVAAIIVQVIGLVISQLETKPKAIVG